MKVLLTGAFGNLGSSSLNEMLKKGFSVRCFDVKNPATEKVAKKYQGKAEIVWGDLTNFEEVKKAVAGVDVVAHLGYIIPPMSEENPGLAEKVNVTGTKNIIASCQAQSPSPKLLFSSSISVHGPQKENEGLVKADAPLIATDNYTRHKIACEKMIRQSGLKWVIFRFGAAPPLAAGGKMSETMFEISLDSHFEFVHTFDVGLAVANAVDQPEAVGKTLLIGGGKKCQMTYKEYLEKYLEAVGIGMLPESAFGKKPYYTHWMETTESQRLLQFQRYAPADFFSEISRMMGWKKMFVKLCRPLVQRSMLKISPYYRK